MFSQVKKIIIGILAGLIFSILPAFAYSGNNQYYSVVLDKEGEAAVLAKLDFQNLKQEPLKEIELVIPGLSVRMINLVQEESQSECSESPEPLSSQSRSKSISVCGPKYSTIKYDKVTQPNGLKLKLSLPQPIASQKISSIMLYYKAQGYVKEKYRVFNFAFETIKSDYDVDNVRVSIDVQEGLFLKEGRAGIAYLPNLKTFEAASNLQSYSSSDLGALSDYVESVSGFVKSTSGLDPGENFIVRGKYYSSSWLASWPSSVSVALVLILLFALVIYIIKKERKEG